MLLQASTFLRNSGSEQKSIITLRAAERLISSFYREFYIAVMQISLSNIEANGSENPPAKMAAL